MQLAVHMPLVEPLVHGGAGSKIKMVWAHSLATSKKNGVCCITITLETWCHSNWISRSLVHMRKLQTSLLEYCYSRRWSHHSHYKHIFHKVFIIRSWRGAHPNKHCTYGCNHSNHLLPCHDHTVKFSDIRRLPDFFCRIWSIMYISHTYSKNPGHIHKHGTYWSDHLVI